MRLIDAERAPRAELEAAYYDAVARLEDMQEGINLDVNETYRRLAIIARSRQQKGFKSAIPSPQGVKLLSILMTGKPYTKRAIVASVLTRSTAEIGDANLSAVLVTRLRAIFGHEIIETIRGQGYIMPPEAIQKVKLKLGLTGNTGALSPSHKLTKGD